MSELTFARSRHATVALMLAVGCLLLSIALLSLRFTHLLYKDQTMTPPAWWLICLPLPFFVLLLWVAWIHLRRPFLVVSRLGIEIHPLVEQETLDHITWVEIKGVSTTPKGNVLVLNLNTEDESQIHITLAPLSQKSRGLLMKALHKIMDFRAQQVAS